MPIVRLVVICARSERRLSKYKPKTLREGQGQRRTKYNTGASLDRPIFHTEMALKKWIRAPQKRLGEYQGLAQTRG